MLAQSRGLIRKPPRFFADLLRRRVFRTLGVYGAGSFAVLQGVDLIQPVLMLPGWVYRATGIVLLAGLPVALVLTWIYDYDEGLVRTPPATAEELDAIIELPRIRRWPMGILAIGGLGLVVLSGWLALSERRSRSVGRDPRPSVAVLPFANRSPQADDSFFTDGLHDDILIELGRVSSLRVIGPTSVARIADARISVAGIADSLGVTALLEGSVQRSGDQVRVSMQLIDGNTEEHLWAQRWDEDLTPNNLLAIQEELARAIAGALRVSLAPEERERLRREAPTQDLEAYEAFLQAQSSLSRLTREGVRDAESLFNEALAADPQFIEARAGLAVARGMAATFLLRGRAATDEFMSARAEAERVVALRPTSGWALLAQGIVSLEADGDAAQAADFLHRALERRPGDVLLQLWYARALIALGRYDDAVRVSEESVRVDPLLAPAHAYRGLALWGAGRLTEADEAYRRAAAVASSYAAAYLEHAVLAVQRADPAGAGEALVELGRALGCPRAEELRVVGRAFFSPADRPRALAEIDSLLQRTVLQETDVIPHLALLGAQERVTAAAALAADSGSQWSPLYRHPLFNPLTGSAALQRLLARSGRWNVVFGSRHR